MAPHAPLPEELLGRIVSHLPVVQPSDPRNADANEEKNLQTLYALSLTSRAFKRITEPKLYHTIPLLDFTRGFNRVWSLLRTFIDKPEITQYVRVLQIGFWQVVPPDPQHLGAAPWKPFGERLLNAVKELSLPLPTHAMQLLAVTIPQAMHGALIIVLLCICSKIETLWIDITRHWSQSLPSNLISTLHSLESGSGATSARPLSSVQDLVCTREPNDTREDRDHVNDTTDAYIRSLDHISQLLSMPSLRSATLQEIKCKRDSEPPLAPRDNIQHLSLESVDLDHHGLARILAAFPQLQSLSLTWNINADITSSQFEDLGSILNQHAPVALRHLSIHLLNPTFAHPAEGFTLPLSSLQSLTTLEDLLLSWVIVSGTPAVNLHGDWPSKILPLSLRTIELTDIGPEDLDIDGEIYDLLLLADRYPHMNTIRSSQDAAPMWYVDVERYGWRISDGSLSFVTLRKRSGTPAALADGHIQGQ